MTRPSLALALSVLAVSGAGPVVPAMAQSARPAFHEQASRLVDEVTGQIRALGSQLSQHMHPAPGAPGAMVAPASPAERPLITMMLHHRSELGLSDEQVSRLEALRGEFAREAIRRDADIRIAELDLAALLAQNPVDLARAETKIRELGQLRAELRIARLRTLERGKALLSAEQRQKLGALADSMAGHHQGGPRPAERGTRL
jgi:Spy/CpxP family protein refolding chaperone